jgi:hypothetical protein
MRLFARLDGPAEVEARVRRIATLPAGCASVGETVAIGRHPADAFVSTVALPRRFDEADRVRHGTRQLRGSSTRGKRRDALALGA